MPWGRTTTAAPPHLLLPLLPWVQALGTSLQPALLQLCSQRARHRCKCWQATSWPQQLAVRATTLPHTRCSLTSNRRTGQHSSRRSSQQWSRSYSSRTCLMMPQLFPESRQRASPRCLTRHTGQQTVPSGWQPCGPCSHTRQLTQLSGTSLPLGRMAPSHTCCSMLPRWTACARCFSHAAASRWLLWWMP